jgi:hypothetical protein
LATAPQVLVTSKRSEGDNGTHNHPQPANILRSSGKLSNIKETNGTTQKETEEFGRPNVILLNIPKLLYL